MQNMMILNILSGWEARVGISMILGKLSCIHLYSYSMTINGTPSVRYSQRINKMVSLCSWSCQNLRW